MSIGFRIVTTQMKAQSGATPPKKKYESARQIERQAGILAATREMLAEVGYAATTMRGLADRAQVAPGTLYNLYKSKDELIVAAVEDLLDDLGQRASGESEEGLERILALAEQTANAILETPKYAEAMSRALFRAEADDPLATLLYARSLPFIKHQLDIALAEGQLLEDAETDVLSRQIQAQSWGIILAWVMGIISYDHLAAEYLRSQLMILLSSARGKTKQNLQARLNAL